MRMNEILIAALGQEVCVFNLLWSMLRNMDKTRATRRTNTILFKGHF